MGFRELESGAISAMTLEERARFEEAVDLEEVRREVAEAVYLARIRAKLTRGMLADRTGISLATVSAVEDGARLPSIATLRRIARATDRRLHLSFGPSNDQKASMVSTR